MLRTYVQKSAGTLIVPAVRYVRTLRFTAKTIYIRSCDSLNTHEAPYPPSGRIGHIVAVFQIVLAGIGDYRIAETPGFQRCQIVFVTPHSVNGIQVFGTDGSIRLEPDISIRFQKRKDVVAIPLHRFTIFFYTVTLRKLEVVGDQPPKSCKRPNL